MKKKLLIALALLLPAMAPAQGEPYRDRSLTAAERAEDLLQRLTLDEKISLMMDASPAIERLGIPEYNWWNEALHGVGRSGIATVFPQCVGLAAIFDDQAVYEAFDIASTEARAKYNRYRAEGSHGRYQGLSFWTPNVNIFRDPRWGRGQETYGEDPCLTSRMGVAVVRGLQGPDTAQFVKSLAGAKHYAVHSGPEWNRHSFDAKDIDPRDLWETYLPAFHALVDAGVWQVMCAYNRFDGEPCCSNERLLTQILRDQWGYDHIVVTDCWAICDFYNKDAHHLYKSESSATAAAVGAGTDLECGPTFASLREAYRKGKISEEAINGAVRRVLTARFLLGELDDNPDCQWNTIPYSVVDCQAHKDKALELARKSMVLLKNNGVLPLGRDAKVVVMGPNANDSLMQWGNYNGYPSHTVTILEGIRGKNPDAPYLRACDHVVNRNAVSRFSDIKSAGKSGMTARYWNNRKGKGKPAAQTRLEVPTNFTTHGATVFAPGVNLTDFCAKYEGTFTAPEDGSYIFTLEADDCEQIVTVNGKRIIKNNTGGITHQEQYIFDAKAGEKFDFAITYSHGEGYADLKFDIGQLLDYDTDPGDADVVIFVGGISPMLEGEEMPVKVPGFRGGDRETIELPQLQRDMIRSLKEQGKRVVLVNCSGSAVALAPEDEICDAIVQAWYPGQAGGQAVADVLYGDYNPAGRLPVTFYRDDSQLPDFEDYGMDGRTYRFMDGKPLYPFGYGLSYTAFDYELQGVEETDGGFKVSISVANTGGRDGEEVAQIYLRSVEKGVLPIALKDFRRQAIAKGEKAVITFDIPRTAFETYSYADGRMQVVPGEYMIMYGGSSDNLKEIKVNL